MLKIKNLTKQFNNNIVLKDININIDKGEIVTLIGPSGSGKSTLLRCISQLESLTSGEILLNNVNLLKSDNKAKLKVGVVFQQFNLFNHYTVLENIIFAPVYHGLYTRPQALELARELLASLNLQGKQDYYPHNLSGGQKQRVAIARCLALDPEIILFDEPTSALDPENVNDVCDLIKSVASKNVACLIITHEMRLVRKIASRVIFLDHGVIVEDKPANELLNNSHNMRVQNYLNVLG